MIPGEGYSFHYFLWNIPDITIYDVTGFVRVTVSLSIWEDDDETDDVAEEEMEIYHQVLFATDGELSLHDIGGLISPYAERYLYVGVHVRMESLKGNKRLERDMTVRYCDGKVSSDRDFLSTQFLTLATRKSTSLHKSEMLYYVGTDKAVTVIAVYADKSQKGFTLQAKQVSIYASMMSIDVSPCFFNMEYNRLIMYTVSAGERKMIFVVDEYDEEYNPIVMFRNSFGMYEKAYCRGLKKRKVEVKRDQDYLKGQYRTLAQKEIVTYTADSGVIPKQMISFWEDVIRSKATYSMENDGARMIAITGEKIEESNSDDELTRVSFNFRYSERVQHSVVRREKKRIFDDTFDETFD